MDAQILAVVAALVILLVVWANRWRDRFSATVERVPVRASDGEVYNVCEIFPEHDRAAEALAHVNKMNVELLRYLRSTVGRAPPALQRRIWALLARYNPQVLSENTPHNLDMPRTTSYTNNKGEAMFICLRSMETDALHGLSVVEFVVLHELAHVATEIWGHDTEYWVNFKWVLQQAKAAGLHEPVDYSKTPIRYCGMDIDYNPYFDAGLANLDPSASKDPREHYTAPKTRVDTMCNGR